MVTLAPPDRSLEQRRAALDRANVVRIARAQIKRELRSGQRSILDVLADPPAELLTASLADLLRTVPRFGAVRVNRFLNVAGIYSHSKTLGSLTGRQRAGLVVLLRQRGVR